jgi:predicted Fe-Mo cluster-binding NifX family protein
MKIAMPLAKGRIAELTENCDRFTIVDVDLTENRILDSCRAEPQAEWLGRLVPWLTKKTVDLVIAVEVNASMRTDLIDKKIRVIAGAPDHSCPR